MGSFNIAFSGDSFKNHTFNLSNRSLPALGGNAPLWKIAFKKGESIASENADSTAKITIRKKQIMRVAV